MRSTTAVSAIVIALACAVPAAQGRFAAADVAPLAGTWELESGAASETRILTVQPESLRIEIVRAGDARPPLLTYRFDGQAAVSPFGAGKATARLLRENGALITETVYEISNAPMTIREVLSVSPDGRELTVNATVRLEHGYEGPLAAGASKSPNVSTAVSVFRKR